MSFWVGFARAQGLGAKVALVKSLAWGTGGDLSFTTYDGAADIVVTIAELAKVDMAFLTLLSGSLTHANVPVIVGPQSFSANTFTIGLATTEMHVSNITSGLVRVGMSGVAISGVLPIKAFIIGEAKRTTFI